MTYRNYQVLQTTGSPAVRYARIREAREQAQAATIAELLLAGCRYIDGYFKYLVSPQGDIYSLHARRVIKMRLGTKPKGYKFVGLKCATDKRYFMVHRLVAKAFIPNPECLPEVNHKDGIKAHNTTANLEWCTSRDNKQHAFDTGLVKRGQYSPRAKLTADQVRAIRDAPGAYRVIGAAFGVCAQTVCNVKSRFTYGDVA